MCLQFLRLLESPFSLLAWALPTLGSAKSADRTVWTTRQLSSQTGSAIHLLSSLRGFCNGSAGEEATYSAGEAGDTSSVPGWGRSPGEGNGNSLQYSFWENPMNRGDWWATVHGVTKSWTQPQFIEVTKHFYKLFSVKISNSKKLCNEIMNTSLYWALINNCASSEIKVKYEERSRW